ncbi:MAG: hypothetical protein JNL11_08820 [Bdellovibrionaceae bacterium]|nr:hypothetical protein [Pseudobdellovibrionaceae bacterium]
MFYVGRILAVAFVYFSIPGVSLVSVAMADTIGQPTSCLHFYAGIETRTITQKATSTLQSFKAIKQEADLIDSQFAKSQIETRLNPPIQMSFESALFRREWLPKITTDKSKREQIMRLVEAELRLSSASVLETIKNKKPKYDIVIIGAGVHGIIAATTLKANNLGLKILIIEKQDTIASRFRTGGSVFVLNSSQRPSGKNKLPLPGEGNLNELPYLPIQVTDLSAQKYPAAKDLGDALLMSAYSLSKMPGVDIVLNTNSETEMIKDNQANVTLFKSGKPHVTIASQLVVRAPGLGLVKLPDEVKSFVTANPEFMTSKSGELPRIATYDQALEILESSNNPKLFFEKKRVMIAGKGNSADTIIEFIIGNNGQAGLSSAQIDLPAKILWAGQDKKTCDEFLRSARLRYSSVGAIFRSSKANGVPVGEAIPAKVEKVNRSVDPNQVDVTMTDGKVYTVDVIILATGLESLTSTEALADYQPISDRILNADKDSKIALFNPDKKEYLVGPGAPGLVESTETKGIVQNTVAIFNHAPRVVALSERLAREIMPISDVISESTPRMVSVISSNKGLQTFRVTQILPIRPTRFEDSKSYLELVFRRALAEHIVPVDTPSISIEMGWDSSTGSIVVVSKDVDVKPLLESLAKTKDFFNIAGVYLKSDVRMKFVLSGTRHQALLSVDRSDVDSSTRAATVIIANANKTMSNEIIRSAQANAPRIRRGPSEPLLDKEVEEIIQKVVSLSTLRKTNVSYLTFLEERIFAQMSKRNIPFDSAVVSKYLRDVIFEVTDIRIDTQRSLKIEDQRRVNEFALEYLFVNFSAEDLGNISKGINIFKNLIGNNIPRANYRLNESLFRRQVQVAAREKNIMAELIESFANKIDASSGSLDVGIPLLLDSYVYAFVILKSVFPAEFSPIEFGNKGLVVFDMPPMLSAEAIGNIFSFIQKYRPGRSDTWVRGILTKAQIEQQKTGYRNLSHEGTFEIILANLQNDSRIKANFTNIKIGNLVNEALLSQKLQEVYSDFMLP